jgi:carbon-monoxide dehydrogenase large subunit
VGDAVASSKRNGKSTGLCRRLRRGIGVAAYTEMCGMAPSRRLAASGFDWGGWESARVAIDSSGRATVYSGSMSQSHGHATVLAQIAADALQMPVENIDVVQGDTKQIQAGHGTFNSRSMPVAGSSVKVCAGRIVEKAKKIAAEMMEVAAEDLSYEGGTLSFRELRLRRWPSSRSRGWRIWDMSCRTE